MAGMSRTLTQARGQMGARRPEGPTGLLNIPQVDVLYPSALTPRSCLPTLTYRNPPSAMRSGE
jgi:hypothetical protein